MTTSLCLLIILNLETKLACYFQPEDDVDYIDLGAAILDFYAVLVNLLGRCAPDLDATKTESVRGRAILQSLVSMADLEGVLSLRFILPPPKMEMQVRSLSTLLTYYL